MAHWRRNNKGIKDACLEGSDGRSVDGFGRVNTFRSGTNESLLWHVTHLQPELHSKPPEKHSPAATRQQRGQFIRYSETEIAWIGRWENTSMVAEREGVQGATIDEGLSSHSRA